MTRRRFKSAADRVLEIGDAHETRHGCTHKTCPLAKALLDAWWTVHEAEMPLDHLFEGIRLLVIGVPCAFACGALTHAGRFRLRDGREACVGCYRNHKAAVLP